MVLLGSASCIADLFFMITPSVNQTYSLSLHDALPIYKLAIERGKAFGGFAESKYATGEYFDKYTEAVWEPATERVRELFDDAGVKIPTQEYWRELKASAMAHGIYNQNLQAVPPTGSMSYINNATPSIHPD